MTGRYGKGQVNDQPATASGRDSEGSSAEAAETRWVRAAVDRYEGPLIQYAARLLAGDVERARDIVQDTFLKLWTADRAAVDGHLGQWLYRVCRNGALDVRRKEARMTTLEHDQTVQDHEPPRTVSSDAPVAFGSVLAMLATLPERQQEVIRLKFQGDLSYREIANVMDLTINHVGVLIHNGLKTIRERLSADAAKVPGQVPGEIQGTR
jgi:RNA polymerase sigma factor (sigma-70 family)